MDDVGSALEAARAAHASATEALRRAEAAAAAAGVPEPGLEPRVIDHLVVKRISVVEDDGTLRIVIGNSTHAATLPVRGRLLEHPGRTPSAGLLFVNDEGTECGGLQYAGATGPDGRHQSGYLTVDDYEQNESLRLGMVQSGTSSQKFLEYVDRPDWSIADLVEGADQPDGVAASRMRLAREEDGSVGLVLRDGEGRDRLRLVVPAEGEPLIEVVDADGTARSLVHG